MDFEDDPTVASGELTLEQKLAGATAAIRRGENWSLGGLQRAMSWIPWAEPLRVTREHAAVELPAAAAAPVFVTRYACRICIANHGLSAADIPRLPTNKNVVHEHVRAVHIDATSDDRLPAPEVSDAGKR